MDQYNALLNMQKKGQHICSLYPHSIPYYRRKGWEIVPDKITYGIKQHQLPRPCPAPGDVRRVKIEGPEFKRAYERYALRTHGAVLRDEPAWNEYWLWNFVSAHFSMIHLVKGDIYTNEPLAFLPEDASIKEEISPYYMARIVDFPAFIAQYPFKKHSMDRMWLFTLEDPMMKYNQGTFLLKISRDGRGEAVRSNARSADRISIQTMTTILMGYKRPDYLAKIGRIRAPESVIDLLEDSIEQRVPYISDYF